MILISDVRVQDRHVDMSIRPSCFVFSYPSWHVSASFYICYIFFIYIFLKIGILTCRSVQAFSFTLIRVDTTLCYISLIYIFLLFSVGVFGLTFDHRAFRCSGCCSWSFYCRSSCCRSFGRRSCCRSSWSSCYCCGGHWLRSRRSNVGSSFPVGFLWCVPSDAFHGWLVDHWQWVQVLLSFYFCFLSLKCIHLFKPFLVS